MKSWPLKWRLSLLICFVVLLIIVTISIVAYIELKESLLKNIDPTLRAMAEGILADLDEPESHEAHEAELRSITGYTDQPHSNRYRIWMDENEKELFAGNTLSDTQDKLFVNLPSGVQPEVGEYTFFNLDQAAYKYRAVWTRHPFEEGVANVLVASSSGYVYHEMREFLRLLLILGGSLVVGSFLLVPGIVGWAMRPIDDVAEVLQVVTPASIEQGILHNLKVPQELLPFVEALDGMLIRLDKAMKQQKQFIADASHELRTPLAVIKSTIQTTTMTDRDVADYTKALDDILQDVNRMERLIEHMLSLAQIDEGEDLSNTTRIALDTLLVNLAEIFDAKASQQGGKVICEDFLPTWVNGDANELDQLFANILDNAVKYGPPEGVISITLSCGPDNYATVCIHDQGGKIPSEALPHLFDRFYRVDSSRSLATGGLGLGLAIAQKIADRHNGLIEITSDIHTGTSVFVRLLRS
jgi:two-component system OmpR family sensor kinase